MLENVLDSRNIDKVQGGYSLFFLTFRDCINRTHFNQRQKERRPNRIENLKNIS